ncbi:MAG TPA: hypothetical protein VLB27_00800 [candidate division Zixibacteria bacterium]|nr:hypothetical protein [candidate division Zixibacteria bacterium]
MATKYAKRRAMYRHQTERFSQPFKWFVALVIFFAALAITFAEVEGGVTQRSAGSTHTVTGSTK